MLHPAVFNTSKICSTKGVKHAVLSPGSRNAPLTLSFARNQEINIFNIIDERSAGFIALGIAQQTKSAVALCCTSGTALLNYGPAVAEAFYQEIPLLIFSADRPLELLNQRDGQTIDQIGSLNNFVKETYQLPIINIEDEKAASAYTLKVNEAIDLANQHPRGPVHINVPFREPFYPDHQQELEFQKPILTEVKKEDKSIDLKPYLDQWNQSEKRLIVVGQQAKDEELASLLDGLGHQAVIVEDIISNSQCKNAITKQDLFLAGIDEALGKSLQADLLITFGKSVISKNLKLFLRKFKARTHWHFDPAEVMADTFQSITDLIPTTPHSFFQTLDNQSDSEFQDQIRINYSQVWKLEEERSKRLFDEKILKSSFSEFTAFYAAMKSIPQNSDLHLANSMPVRYANFIQGLPKNVEVFCNRGTSGIDGTNGTAVGHALTSQKPVTLLTGDLSFFYDRNAFFHHYDLSNLKIIVFNNQGGGIFRLIKGPAGLPELSQHFETRHQHSAKYTAIEYGFDYYKATDKKSLEVGLKSVFEHQKSPQLLEVFIDPETNQQVYQEMKITISNR